MSDNREELNSLKLEINKLEEEIEEKEKLVAKFRHYSEACSEMLWSLFLYDNVKCEYLMGLYPGSRITSTFEFYLCYLCNGFVNGEDGILCKDSPRPYDYSPSGYRLLDKTDDGEPYYICVCCADDSKFVKFRCDICACASLEERSECECKKDIQPMISPSLVGDPK